MYVMKGKEFKMTPDIVKLIFDYNAEESTYLNLISLGIAFVRPCSK